MFRDVKNDLGTYFGGWYYLVTRTPPEVGTPNAQVHKGHDEIHVFEWKYSYGNEVNRFTNVISSCGLIM